MSFLEFKFDITEVQNCPLYKNGDYCELSGVIFTPPKKKKTCVLLAKVTADILSESEGKSADLFAQEIIGREFHCPGCTGVVKVVCSKKEEGWCIPQFRAMKALEAKRAMAEKMSALEGQLQEFSLLNCLDEHSLKDFVSCSTLHEFPPGHTLLQVDTPGKNLILLLSGRVVLLGRQGETIRYLGKGEVLGEMSLMFNRLVNVTVKVVEPVKVMMVNEQDFHHLLMKFPFMKMELARMMAKRLSIANEPISMDNSPGVKGQLKELPASELFQMIHENMKSGTVELTLAGGKAWVDFNEGEIVKSEYKGKVGKEAFFEIILEQDGSFVFTNIAAPEMGKAEPIGGFMSLLMEGLRLLDEKRSQPVH